MRYPVSGSVTIGITGIPVTGTVNLMGSGITLGRNLWLRYVGVYTTTGGVLRLQICDITGTVAAVGGATALLGSNVKVILSCPSGPTGMFTGLEFVEPGMKFSSSCAVCLPVGGTATVASYIFGCGYEA